MIRYKAYFLLLFLLVSFSGVSQDITTKLTGDVIGTHECVDYDNNNQLSYTVNTATNLSGGYLLEIDTYAANAGSNLKDKAWFETSRNRTPVTIKSPKDDEIVPEQTSYIKAHYNKMEAALYASNYKDPLNGYRKYFDTGSFVRHFLVGEISGNTDTNWSVYMYKHRDDDVFYFGPVWDFDLAYENDNRTYQINDKTNWVYTYGNDAYGMKAFVNRLFTDNGECEIVYYE